MPTLTPIWGGIFQYSLTMLEALVHSVGYGDDIVVFATDLQDPALASLVPRASVQPLMPKVPASPGTRVLDMLRGFVGEGPHREAWRRARRGLRATRRPPHPTVSDIDRIRFRPELRRWFLQCGVELMLYPTSSTLAFETGIPYVMAIHDLQHRLQPEFPEVSANGEREFREYYFRNGARYATLLLADSEVGKEDILNCYGHYGVNADRVRVLPFLPANYLVVDVPDSERRRIRARYRLPDRYLFYPAQFWPHKNHARIVRALALLKREHRLDIPFVMCGACTGDIRARTFGEVMSLAAELGVEREMRYLGYAPNEDMSALYAEATALVMPTFFGPTNIPILEAWASGCPVLTSDIRGIREQVQDAAILVDPRSVDAIARGVFRLWTEAEVGRTLAERGRQRLASYTPEDYRSRLRGILEDAKDRVRAVGVPRSIASVVSRGGPDGCPRFLPPVNGISVGRESARNEPSPKRP